MRDERVPAADELRASRRDPGSARLVVFLIAAIVVALAGHPFAADELDSLLREAEPEAPAAGESGLPPGAAESPASPKPAPAMVLPAAPSRPVEEIVVTANRRVQNVQDIPNSIRVLGGEDLEKSGVTGFEDYVFKIPGADLGDSGMEKKIAIRGIGNIASNSSGAGGSASPIGLYLNDTPIQGNGVLPDLALYDLERIEVLKGPQGTLYGEGAQGGAIKMLLNKADPSGYSAKGEVGFGKTRHAGGWNHLQNAMVNGPITDSWAIRLVGSRRETRGFVDFPARGTRGEDDAENLMGRIHLDGELWEGLSVSGMLLHQRQRLDQFPQIQTTEPDLTNRNGEPQFADTDFTLAGLTLEYDLGFAELTSSTSGFTNDREMLSRYPFLGAIAFIVLNPVIGGGVQQTPGPENEWIQTDNHQFSIAQELRLVSQTGSWLDWVAGVFYRVRDNDFNFLGDNDASDEPPPVGPGVFEFLGTESFEQFAGFGEVTVDLPWRLEFNAGLRVFHETAELVGQAWGRGPLYAPLAISTGNPEATPGVRRFSNATVEVTPKASLSWFFDDQRMLYALVANGVRSGGTNTNALPSSIPPLFSPDSLWTYEVGAKTLWLDGLFTANLSLFHNDWRDLQVYTTEVADIGGVPTALALVLNVGRAYSRGTELELSAFPVGGLTVGFNLALLDGEITEGDPAGVVADGTDLPQVSNLSYAASAQYELLDWPLFGLTPFLSFATQRAGGRIMSPPSTLEAPRIDGFQLFNSMVGLSNESWDLTFGVQNLSDARPQLGANFLSPETKTIGTPRTWMTRVSFRY